MRYHVRNEKGEELVCPTLGDLHSLYRQGFLGDDDQVRPERSRRWERLGDFAAFQGERASRREPRQVLLLLAALALAALAMWLFAGRR
jgi:hypothetical protein